jgi:hypothetical protein
MADQLRLPNEGTANIVAIDGERVGLLSTRAAAPGCPLAANMMEDGALVRVKVHRCRKQGERFLIEGRLIDATRPLRERLATLVATNDAPSKGAG